MSNTHQPEPQDFGEEAMIAALRGEVSAEDAESGARVSQALQAKMDVARASVKAQNTNDWSSKSYRYLGAAAVLVIGIVAIKLTGGSYQQADQYKTYTTSPAQRAKITLADGSTVLLAPSTTIRYTQTFGKANRNIELDGQALFTVTHASGVPFIIKTSNTSVRVLGTSFTVRKYSADTEARVVVAEGKVAVSDAVLTSGDAGTVTDAGSVDVKRGADIARELSWTTGRLHFADARLGDVLPELSRWYGVTFKAHQSLLSAPVTAAFDIESPQQAADILTLVLRATATRTADGYMLAPVRSTTTKR